MAYGLRFLRTLSGRPPVTMRCFVPASDGTALFHGDIVELVNTTGTMDAASEYPCVTRATTGHILLGVVQGFDPDGSYPLTGNYRGASTARYVNVNVDTESVYSVLEDGLGTPVTAAGIGAMFNYNIVVATGSTVTGLSGTMLNSDSGASASAADLKVVGVVVDKVNAVGTQAELEVMILAPAIKATDSES